MLSEDFLQKMRKILKEHLHGVHEDQTIDVKIKIEAVASNKIWGKPVTYVFNVTAVDNDGTEVTSLSPFNLSLRPGDSIHIDGFRLPIDIDKI